jgi:hypothetical protein
MMRVAVRSGTHNGELSPSPRPRSGARASFASSWWSCIVLDVAFPNCHARLLHSLIHGATVSIVAGSQKQSLGGAACTNTRSTRCFRLRLEPHELSSSRSSVAKKLYEPAQARPAQLHAIRLATRKDGLAQQAVIDGLRTNWPRRPARAEPAVSATPPEPVEG